MALRNNQLPNLGKLSYTGVQLVLLAGAALRVVVWWQNRSLFIDEANLARNFCEKSATAFFQPLAHDQYAPPLFSLFQKCSVWCLGHQELALRLFPLLCSLASIWLFFQLAKRLISSNWILLATVWIFSFSDFFLRYATEGKQYGCDLAVALGLLFWGLQHSQRPMRLIWPMLIGAGAVWLSMPAVFVLFGLGMYGLQDAWSKKDKKALLRQMAVAGVWLLSFAVYYWVLLRPSFGVVRLVEYHQSWFFPLLPGSMAEWKQATDLLLEFPYYTAGHTVLAKLVGSAGILTGLFWLCRTKNPVVWLLTAPVLACLLASGFGKYSLIPRLLVWAFPLVLLVQGLGWQRWWDAGRKGFWQGLCLLLFGLTASLHTGWQYFSKPYQIEEIRRVLDRVRQDFQPGDVLYCSHEAWPALAYYRECHTDRGQYQFEGRVVHGGLDGPLRPELLTLDGTKPRRVWLVFSHVISNSARAAMQADVALARDFASQKKIVEMPGAYAYLFVSRR